MYYVSRLAFKVNKVYTIKRDLSSANLIRFTVYFLDLSYSN